MTHSALLVKAIEPYNDVDPQDVVNVSTVAKKYLMEDELPACSAMFLTPSPPLCWNTTSARCEYQRHFRPGTQPADFWPSAQKYVASKSAYEEGLPFRQMTPAARGDQQKRAAIAM